MNNLFNMDNKFFTFMSKVADLVILNILCLLLCFPIVTAGVSITALHYVTLKMVNNEEAYIARSFFKSVKENFKQATIIWIIILVVGGVFFADLRILALIDSSVVTVLRAIILAMMFVFFMVVLYIFPVLSKFDNTVKNTFKNAFFMAIRHLPWTIAMAAITVVPFLVILFIPSAFSYGILVLILAGFSLIAYCNSFIFNRIFKIYIPEEEDEAEDTDDKFQMSDTEAELLQYQIPKDKNEE